MNSAIERIYRRVLMVIGRGRVTYTDDTGSVQMLQIKLNQDQIRDNTPRLAEFGFTSVPPAGSDVSVVFIAGDRSNGVVVATGHQASRLKNLQVGEVAIYDDQGQSVYLTRAGIVINGAGLPITINGNITLNGSLTATGDVIAGGKSLEHHVHGGITPGGSNTSAPV